MTGFDDRERQFEQKFAHDEELRFKVRARRAKLVGLWAARLMGMEGKAAEDYALSLVGEDLKEPGDQDVIDRLMEDFRAHGVDIDVHRVERELAHRMEEAQRQVMEENRE